MRIQGFDMNLMFHNKKASESFFETKVLEETDIMMILHAKVMVRYFVEQTKV